ncbi:MAG: hypothetical protein N2234_04490, partial [Planctomycetota bacterium]|nr:hypothetical protein [Planctomycetota bacterium]
MKESLLSLGLFFLLVGVTAAENNDENDFCQNLVSSIRTAYKRLKEYAVEDFEECRKLLSDSKEKV